MAEPSREVYVLVGDGSYLMMSAEIATSVQEGQKLTIVLMDNWGFKSIGALSRSLGQGGFGTRSVYRLDGVLPGDVDGDAARPLPIDLAANARSLGAHVIECQGYDDVATALATARTIDRTVVLYVRNDRLGGCRATRAGGTCPSPRSARSKQSPKHGGTGK